MKPHFFQYAVWLCVVLFLFSGCNQRNIGRTDFNNVAGFLSPKDTALYQQASEDGLFSMQIDMEAIRYPDIAPTNQILAETFSYSHEIAQTFLKGTVENITEGYSAGTASVIYETDNHEYVSVSTGANGLFNYTWSGQFISEFSSFEYLSSYSGSQNIQEEGELKSLSLADAKTMGEAAMESLGVTNYQYRAGFAIQESDVYCLFYFLLADRTELLFTEHGVDKTSNVLDPESYIAGSYVDIQIRGGEITRLYISGEYTILDEGEPVSSLLTADEAAQRAFTKYSSLILTNTTRITEQSFVYAAQRTDYEGGQFLLVPAWCFQVETDYIQYDANGNEIILTGTEYLLINAETGEEML